MMSQRRRIGARQLTLPLSLYKAFERWQRRDNNTSTSPLITLTMSTQKELDPYTAKAQNDNLSPQEKVEGLHSIIKKVQTGMLTSRSRDGQLHSRAMAPAGRTSHFLHSHCARILVLTATDSGGPQPDRPDLHREPRVAQV